MSELKSSTDKTEETNELELIENELVSVNPEIQKVLRGLNKTKKETILRSTSLVIKQHSGPLPDPETLDQYNNIIKDGAERIMVMAEKAQNHGIEITKTAIRRASFQHLLGQIFAYTLALASIWFGYELTTKGFEAAGITIFGTTVGAIVIAFLRSGRS